MANEVKTIPGDPFGSKKEEIPDNLPVIMLDRWEEVVSEQEQEDAVWHELKNAYLTGKIVEGILEAVEKTPNDNKLIAVTSYKGQKIVIPASEFIENDTSAEVQQKIMSSMIGAEISFILLAINNAERSAVGSRIRANERNRKKFYLTKDAKGRYKIYEGSLVQARVIGIRGGLNGSIRVELFGIETTIYTRELSWDWVSDASASFSVGYRVIVKITSISGRSEDNPLVVEASVRLAVSNKQEELIKQMRNGNLYAGQVIAIRKGTYLLKLNNGVNAMAHSTYSRKSIVKNDTVAFLCGRIDKKTLVVTGSITRLIKHNV